MKRLLLIAIILFAPCVAYAQQGTNVPPGQGNGNVVNIPNYLANTDASGFSEQGEAGNVTPLVGTGVAQVGATILPARMNYVACVTGSTAVQLPAVARYTPVTIVNRGSAACLVFPPPGGYLETTAGTLGAVNASFTLAAGADVIFRPTIQNGQAEFLQ